MSEVVLEYKREQVDLSTGRILYREPGQVHVLASFEKVEFRPMLRDFAQALQKNPEARGVWQRTDRPGLVPYYLDPALVMLFRTDPVAAIESMCPNIQSPSLSIKRTKQPVVVPVSIRACYDALADAFGDLIYSRCNMTRNIVECPCCGMWILNSTILECRNKSCALGVGDLILAQQASPKWVGLQVKELLALGSPRYYFPRAWNGYRPWITWKTLQTNFDEYNKEKEQWQSPDSSKTP